MRKSIAWAAILLVVSFVAGCATGRVMITTSKQFPPSLPSEVKVYLTEKPTTPFEEIGRVSVNKFGPYGGIPRSTDTINQDMREKAASIGGDAIVNVKEDPWTIYGDVIKISTDKK